MYFRRYAPGGGGRRLALSHQPRRGSPSAGWRMPWVFITRLTRSAEQYSPTRAGSWCILTPEGKVSRYFFRGDLRRGPDLQAALAEARHAAKSVRALRGTAAGVLSLQPGYHGKYGALIMTTILRGRRGADRVGRNLRRHRVAHSQWPDATRSCIVEGACPCLHDSPQNCRIRSHELPPRSLNEASSMAGQVDLLCSMVCWSR